MHAKKYQDVFRQFLTRFRNGLIRRGMPPSWFGYKWVQEEGVRSYLKRKGFQDHTQHYETIHPEAVAQNPLPHNVSSRDTLPDVRGWWGFSFHDVPNRKNGETFIATLRKCRVVPYIDEEDEFWVSILNADDRLIDLREIHFRAGHAQVLRSSAEPVRLKRATWILERVYHNYSHWLTAHLPKLLLLKERHAIQNVLLPPARPSFIDESMKLVGLDPDAFATFNPARPLAVEELTVLSTDRFRPELLQSVRSALPDLREQPPERKVYISREKAPRRRLLNEEEVWPLLDEAGFEKVVMEDLPFPDQVRLMQETAVLAAPHGAGLTNMMFCPEGTHIVEIADLNFPNPNFYAVASAMGHHYWLLEAEGVGNVHPLEKDMRVERDALEQLLERVLDTSRGHRQTQQKEAHDSSPR